MRAIITIEMDGAAFEPSKLASAYAPDFVMAKFAAARELYDVLHEVARKIDGRALQPGMSDTVRDSNGNACGTFEIVE